VRFWFEIGLAVCLSRISLPGGHLGNGMSICPMK
jgi:hypothetical protein